MPRTAFTIVPVRTSDDVSSAASLFRAYAASLDVDLSYQNFENEVRALPGLYAPPDGELLLARSRAGLPLGCVAMRATLEAGCCEMKRLYVDPSGRGMGLGAALVNAIVSTAGRAGYGEIRLDTLPFMSTAIALYRDLGFTEMAPYYDTPVPGTLFLRKRL